MGTDELLNQGKMNANQIISKLRLEPLEPEGGYFRRTYLSNELGGASTLSCIYYLMTALSYSRFHRLTSDEIYHFYSGSPVEMLLLDPEQGVNRVLLGNDLNHHVPQVVVPKGVWQASRMASSDEFDYSLVGTTVSPAFRFEDFELADVNILALEYPDAKRLIEKFR